MITATIVGNIVDIKETDRGRVGLRLRVRVSTYEDGEETWKSFYSTAFVPEEWGQRFGKGDSVTVIADIVPTVYNGNPGFDFRRIHKIARNHQFDDSQTRTDSAQTAGAAQKSDNAAIEDILSDDYDPFLE